MECLQQEPLTALKFIDNLAYELGSLFGRIHSYRMAGYGDPLNDNSLSSDSSTYFTMKFEEGIPECNNHLPKALIEKCLRYYEKNLYLLDSVDGPCIVHRDFRQANVMIYNSKAQGVVDWSSARGSFAEEDFCVLMHDGWKVSPLSKQFFSRVCSYQKST
jgi:Ser/Thr protein kinase RdoA (MazF antagonist)